MQRESITDLENISPIIIIYVVFEVGLKTKYHLHICSKHVARPFTDKLIGPTYERHEKKLLNSGNQ